ncbi:hypothetical protein Y032_0061g3196 [Ancylostoma ceylanicum]|uniref:Uncharacterized protein n=1 Tax=Ancylostoma ceylanicum TaxID=53326 RepID=A0A016U2U0_9BILA|nr:hypothetical protein Y032_0061g3196 [Ancylostoma ceylanicum]
MIRLMRVVSGRVLCVYIHALHPPLSIVYASTLCELEHVFYGYRNPRTFGPISCDGAHVELSNLKYVLQM